MLQQLFFSVLLNQGLAGLRSRASSPQGYIRSAIILFTVTTLVFLAYDLFSMPQNLYTVAGVSRLSSKAEMRKSFKESSLRLHPDRGGSEAEFRAMKEAFDVLSDESLARVYDRFGPEVAGNPHREAYLGNGMQMFIHHGMYYMVLGVLFFVGTIGADRRWARQPVMGLLLGCLVLELAMAHSGFDLLAELLPRTALFEKVKLVRQLVLYMDTCLVLWAMITYVDTKAAKITLLLEIVELQKRTLDYLASEPWNERSGVKVDIGLREKLEKMEQVKKNMAAEAQAKKAGGFPWGVVVPLLFLALQFFASK